VCGWLAELHARDPQDQLVEHNHDPCLPSQPIDRTIRPPSRWRHFPYFNDEMGAAVSEGAEELTAFLMRCRTYDRKTDDADPQRDPEVERVLRRAWREAVALERIFGETERDGAQGGAPGNTDAGAVRDRLRRSVV
jgi:hypothetical protein